MYSRDGDDTTISAERGLSPIFGLILLIGLVATVSTGILLVAMDTTEGVEQQAETEQVEKSFMEMSQELGTASSQDATREMDLDIDSSRGTVNYRDTGKIQIETEGGTNSTKLGSIEYVARDGTTIVYQGGGVWRQDVEDATIISKPNVQYSNGTLNLPVRQIKSGNSFSHGSMTMMANDSDQFYAGQLADGESVTITITSEYYEWWASYFEDEFNDATIDPNSNKDQVQVTFTGPPDDTEQTESDIGIVADFNQALSIEGALSTSSGGSTVGDVRSSGDAVINNDVDGHVLSESDVHVTTSTGSVTDNVVAYGDVTIESNVEGDVIAGESVHVTSAGSVDGDIIAKESVDVDGDVGGNISTDGTVQVDSNVGGYIITKESVHVDGDVGGTISTDGTVQVNSNVGGDIITKESVHVDGNVGGNISTDGTVQVNSNVDGTISTTGDVEIHSTVAGDVITAGDVTGDRPIEGHIVSGGEVAVTSDVHGNVFADGNIDYGWGNINGELYASEQIIPPQEEYCNWSDCGNHNEYVDDINGTIESVYGADLPNLLSKNDDNINQPAIDPLLAEYLEMESDRQPLDDEIASLIDDGEEFGTLESEDPVEAGTYYVNDVDVNPNNGSENTLTFDVSEGDVNVIVKNDITLEDDAHIRVENADSGNVVRFYSTDEFSMSGGTSICPVPKGEACPNVDNGEESNANVLQFYGTPNSTYTFSGDSVLHGLIYAPSNSGDNVEIAGGGSLELFGSIVAGGFETNGDTKMIYDETLNERYEEPQVPENGGEDQNENTEENEDEADLEYLNVTVYEIIVENK